MYRKQLNLVLDQVVNNVEEIEPELLEDYRKLNDRCDVILNKIKQRKQCNSSAT